MQILSRLLKKSNWNSYVILLVLGTIIFSCSSPNTWYFKEGGTLLWVDSRHEDKAIKSAIQHTLEHSSIFVAQIPWSPNDSSFFKNTAWYFSLAKDHGKSFMIAIDWQKVDRSGALESWSFADPKIAALFKRDMLRLVKTYNPDYINLGVEANYYALTSPEGFRAFVSTFRNLKQELKQLNLNLKVGLSYQLELLYGHHEGWNESETLSTLDVIQGDIDFLGISTYPNMVLEKKQSNILFSIKYLDSLSQAYSIPIGISETAISSSLYEEKQREDYVKSIFEKANNLNFKFVIWGSVIDAAQNNTWSDKLGLLDMGGNPKKEFNIWKIENENFYR
jgi:hypothetical protein